MLSGEGNAGERWKTTVGLISKKSNFARVAHFFVHFFAVVLHDYNFQKRFSYAFLGGNVVLVLVHFFFTDAHFHLALVAAIISHFSPPPLQNFHAVLPTKKMSPFFISRSGSLSPFFSFSFADLPLIFSISLSFSCSIFQICGHDN